MLSDNYSHTKRTERSAHPQSTAQIALCQCPEAVPLQPRPPTPLVNARYGVPGRIRIRRSWLLFPIPLHLLFFFHFLSKHLSLTDIRLFFFSPTHHIPPQS